MNPQVLLAILALADRATSALQALSAVKGAVRTAQAEGRDLTLDDLKQFQLQDDAARDILVSAIEEAENG